MTAKHHVARIASVLVALALAAPAFADPPSLWKDEPPAAATHPDNRSPHVMPPSAPAAPSDTAMRGVLGPALVGLLLVGVGFVVVAAVVRRTAGELRIAGHGEES